MDRRYVVGGSLFSLHLVPRGEASPVGATPGSPWQLRLLLDRAPKPVLGDLLRGLGLSSPGSGLLDTADQLRVERQLFDRIGDRFDIHRLDRQLMSFPVDGADEDALGPAPAPATTHWIGVQLLDKKTGEPLPGRPYTIVDSIGFPDASGKLGADGTARVDGLADAGERTIQCPAYPAVDEQDHVVKQGEHASGIAEKLGYENYHDVWDDPSNADLAKLRKPHVLFPGDVLHIPARPDAPSVNKPVDQFHVFQIDRSPLKLLVELHDNFKHALAGLDVSFLSKTTKTDDKGLYTTDVDKQQRGGALSLPARDLNLAIGHLDPIEEDTGWRARLVNLGFMWDDDGGPDEDHIALEDFQADQGLDITGELDDKTRAKILTAHGC